MREIKFRAWDREQNKWSEIALRDRIYNIPYLTDYEWCQYTGLKDQKGVEIYEGDILHGTIKDLLSQGYQNGIVKWGSYGFVIDLQKQPWEPGIGIVGFGSFTDYEVIGNIHEGENDEK